jgi:low affinity Fe/Cu permease
MEKDQRMESDKQNDMTEKLNQEINRMMDTHRNERETIENTTWNNIDQLRNKNKEELGKIIDDGMQAKANLTLALNLFKKKNEEKDLKNNDIVRKDGELKELYKKTNALE